VDPIPSTSNEVKLCQDAEDNVIGMIIKSVGPVVSIIVLLTMVQKVQMMPLLKKSSFLSLGHNR
jgi:hypothetical protein